MRRAVLLGTLLAIAVPAESAEILGVTGPVAITRDDGTRTPARDGFVLRPGDRVITEAAARVAFEFGGGTDRSIVRLGPFTTVRIPTGRHPADLVLEVERGLVRLEVRHDHRALTIAGAASMLAYEGASVVQRNPEIDEVALLVQQGTVKLVAPGATRFVKAGERAVLAADDALTGGAIPDGIWSVLERATDPLPSVPRRLAALPRATPSVAPDLEPAVTAASHPTIATAIATATETVATAPPTPTAAPRPPTVTREPVAPPGPATRTRVPATTHRRRAPSAEPKPSARGESAIGDWTLRCETLATQVRTCFLFQNEPVPGESRQVLHTVVAFVGGADPTAILTFPGSVHTASDVVVTVDGDRLTADRVDFCDPRGCHLGIVLDDGRRARLEAGAVMKVRFQTTSGPTRTVSLSLRGIREGLEHLASAQP